MTELTVKTAGAELFVCEHGSSTRQPIILIHGGPGIAGTLSDLGKDIQDCGRIIEYDQRGTKRSASSGPFEIKNHLEDLRELIEKTCAQKPILIGHSFGGFFGLCFAATHEKLISKLIVISCAPLTQAAGREMDERLLSRFSEAEMKKREQLLAMKTGPNITQTTKDESDVELMKLLFPKYQHNRKSPLHHLRPRNMTAVMEANKEYMALRNNGELLKMLTKITIPVTAFHGESDVIPPSGSLPVLLEHIQHSESFLLKESGHFPWHEDNAQTEFLPKLKRQLIFRCGS